MTHGAACFRLHTLVASGAAEALCASISARDRASAKESARVEACPCAGVDESSSADEDTAAMFWLPLFNLGTVFLRLPDIFEFAKK